MLSSPPTVPLNFLKRKSYYILDRNRNMICKCYDLKMLLWKSQTKLQTLWTITRLSWGLTFLPQHYNIPSQFTWFHSRHEPLPIITCRNFQSFSSSLTSSFTNPSKKHRGYTKYTSKLLELFKMLLVKVWVLI